MRFYETATRVANTGNDDDAFRLVSYNILAYMYSTAKGASTIFFRQCPLPYLEPDYRFPLVHRELLAYNADVICLQEVDESHFERRLRFLMQTGGDFEGHHLTKLLVEVPEGTKSVPPPEPIANYPRKVNEGEKFCTTCSQVSIKILVNVKQ